MASQARTFFFNVSDGLKKEIPYVVKEAIISGLWFDGVFMPKPICPLSDCSWETFTSMGLCSTCGTANPQARLTCNLDFDYPTSGSVNHTTRKRWSDQRSCNITFRENVTWPVNVNVEWVSSKILADGTEVAWTYQITAPGYAMYPIYSSSHQHGPLMTEYDTIQGVKNPLFAIGIAHFELTNTSLSLTLAEECVVNFCLRDYSMSFTNSTPEVKVSNIRNGAGFWGPPVNLLGADYCWSAEDEDFVTNSSGRLSEYEITNTFDFDLAHFSFCSHKPGFSAYWQDALTEMFWGNLPTTVNMNCVPSTTSQYNCVSKSSTELSSPMDDLTNTAVTDSGVHRIASVGASTVLKNIVDSVTLLNMNTNATIIKGKAGSRVTYVHVRWAWLSLPLLTILVGFAFLAWTIFDTKRHNVPLWKGSILALMFHGFQEGQLKGQIVAESVSGMERMARNMAVTLRENDVEGRTVFTSGSAFNEDEQARKRNTMPRTAVELVLY
ncbi:hypothetical protein H2198_010717 [Neophaeococcomyces mojaviensis]|uniref:Uncharacterized protein n=1 Tax=Neophaeococcomyces mojaviensis TaxID=3383035 RepID=A0ACC2ZR05_9EURO|nr:hypothetical protein H2198_010717 [Knufia sp. JES_112]